MKVSNVRHIVRYKSPDSRSVNVKKGSIMEINVDVLFYLYRGKRVIISDQEFYNKWIKIGE